MAAREANQIPVEGLKMRFCDFFVYYGNCTSGNRCRFLHHRDEVRFVRDRKIVTLKRCTSWPWGTVKLAFVIVNWSGSVNSKLRKPVSVNVNVLIVNGKSGWRC